MNPKNQMSTTDSEERLEDRKDKLDLPVVLPRETNSGSILSGGWAIQEVWEMGR